MLPVAVPLTVALIVDTRGADPLAGIAWTITFTIGLTAAFTRTVDVLDKLLL